MGERANYYVYAWTRPDTGDVFYIGKGKLRRDVRYKHHNPIFTRIVDKLKRNGLEPTVERIRENLTDQEACAVEIEEISRRGRIDLGTGPLANLTDGGDGTSGWVPSAETKARQSDAAKGKIKSPEHRANLSLSMTGKTLSSEHKQKVGLATLGKMRNADVRNNMRSSFRQLGVRTNSTSGFRGVNLNKKTGRWLARIDACKRINIGTFDTPEEAAIARDAVALKIWGEGAFLNFPQGRRNENVAI